MSARRTKGFALIGSYLLLSALFLYSNALTMTTIVQQAAADRMRETFEARNLATAALETLREDLNRFLTVEMYAWTAQGNAIQALQWLDDLGTGKENPIFDLPKTDANGDGAVDWADGTDQIRDGTADNPTCLTLPVTSYSKGTALAPPNATATFKSPNGKNPNDQAIQATAESGPTSGTPACRAAGLSPEAPRAWLVSVEPVNKNDPLSPRRVTLDAEAKAGGVTKRMEAVYEIDLGMSDVFKYAYFINNYGWFDTGDAYMRINGDVRANGDLRLTVWGGNYTMTDDYNDIHGNFYASENPELINPQTGQKAQGFISGDAGQYSTEKAYWEVKGGHSRPLKNLVFPGQPAPGGTTKSIPWGWDPYHNPAKGGAIDQQRFERQPTQPMPYLGDLDYYKTLAKQRKGELKGLVWVEGVGYRPKVVTVDGIYAGVDGVLGTADDKNPLVILGGYANPIEITGPVVVPGDVIIKGVVKGRGTVYAGRNVHVVGNLTYASDTWGSASFVAAPRWESLQRNTVTGEVREVWCCPGRGSSIGIVCKSGTFYPYGQTPPAGCL